MKKDQVTGNSKEMNLETMSEQTENSNPVDPSGDFFAALENEVNGAIQEQTTAEKGTTTGTDMATQVEQPAKVSEANWDGDENPYKKRYGDSSREAQKMKQELDNLRPFVPVLEAMKKDSGLVEHVRDYLQTGGAPTQAVEKKLGLPEDFEFDANEAVTSPDSDSGRLLNTYVDGAVQARVKQMVQSEKDNVTKIQQKARKQKEESEFKEKHNMTDEEFTQMVGNAQQHTLTLEDVYYLVNRDKSAANIADNTKKDMLKQMKNVQSMPTSAGSTNSAGSANKSQDDQLFDSILGSDSNFDKLFGG
tara:strand:- start:1534 stop:2448 length:915 start_codon:yes stop_codon:yes gene_type:complete